MIWDAYTFGEDTIDRLAKNILHQACNNDEEEREFLDALYRACNWAYQSEEARKGEIED